MPDNIVDIPFVNPIRFVPVGTPTGWQFDNDWFLNQIYSFQQRVQYAQKWVVGDVIRLQVQSNFAPMLMEAIRCDGSLIQTYTPVIKPTSQISNGFTVYEFTIPVPDVSGYYYLVLNVGDQNTLERFISEPQQNLSSTENTLWFNYHNTVNNFDVVFETNIQFGFRVEAVMGQLEPLSVDAVWQDQPLNLKTISSKPYRQFKLIIGDAAGVPDWVADKINRILACNTVLIDGYQYTKAEGAKLEANAADNYPMRSWRVDLRETKNRYSLRGQNNFSPAESFAVVYNIDTKAFGTFNGNVSGNVIQVTKVD